MRDVIEEAMRISMRNIGRTKYVAEWSPADGSERIPFVGWLSEYPDPDEGKLARVCEAFRGRFALEVRRKVQEPFVAEDTEALLSWFRSKPATETDWRDVEDFVAAIPLAMKAADLHLDAYRATHEVESWSGPRADDGLLAIIRGRIERLERLSEFDVEAAARACAIKMMERTRTTSAIWRNIAPEPGEAASPAPGR